MPRPGIVAILLVGLSGAVVFGRNPELKGPMSAFAYETLNFVDGKRPVAEIRDLIAAIYGPIPLDVVAEYLGALESIDVVRRQRNLLVLTPVALINSGTPATIKAYVDSAFGAEMRGMPMAAHLNFMLGHRETWRGSTGSRRSRPSPNRPPRCSRNDSPANPWRSSSKSSRRRHTASP